jgi:5-formyltetrahydrofolate cyclo-ligase
MADSSQESGRLRRRFREQRRNLTPAEQDRHAHAVAASLSRAGVLLKAHTCGIYFAFLEDGELDTLPLIARLWSMGRTVACPVIDRDGAMDFYRITPVTKLVSNQYGILEPATRGRGAGRHLNPRAMSVLFMPLVAFDDSGSRLGMGAGYYDRYLGRLSPGMRPLLVGLAHGAQRSPEPLRQNDWDVPLDGVVTENGWQPFSPRAKVFAPSASPRR